MKLFYTPNSPYARIARLAVREIGIAASVEECPALSRQDDNPVLAFSPVGRVPVLITDGLVITEAKNVVACLCSVAGLETSCGISGQDWTAIQQEGQILGFLEGIAFWVREGRRGPLTSDELIAVEAKRCARCLNYFDGEAVRGKLQPFPSFRSMALASALDLMVLHGFAPQWQARHPALAAWFTTTLERPSMQQTRPVA